MAAGDKSVLVGGVRRNKAGTAPSSTLVLLLAMVAPAALQDAYTDFPAKTQDASTLSQPNRDNAMAAVSCSLSLQTVKLHCKKL
jgi:hypothetical protein